MIDHILDHKLNLGEFKKIEIVSSIFHYKTMGFDIFYGGKKKNCKKHKHIEA